MKSGEVCAIEQLSSFFFYLGPFSRPSDFEPYLLRPLSFPEFYVLHCTSLHRFIVLFW